MPVANYDDATYRRDHTANCEICGPELAAAQAAIEKLEADNKVLRDALTGILAGIKLAVTTGAQIVEVIETLDLAALEGKPYKEEK